jgi:hypothetical protein
LELLPEHGQLKVAVAGEMESSWCAGRGKRLVHFASVHPMFSIVTPVLGIKGQQIGIV